MDLIRNFLHAFTKKELRVLAYAVGIFFVALIARTGIAVQEHSAFVPMDGGVFREGVVGQPTLINPAISDNQVDRDLSALLFSKLSELATHIKADEKNKVFTVSLKENLLWDDGTPVTSDDVLFTIKTIQNPDARSPFLKKWSGVAAERISQLQVRIAIPEENIFFKEIMDNLRIIPAHIYGSVPIANIRLSSYILEPVGNGPYSFKKFSQKKNGFITEYVLESNEKYSGKKPYIDEFRFIFYEDEEALENAFRVREIDAFGTASPITTKLFDALKARAARIPVSRYYALFFNTNGETLNDRALRRALVAGISKEKIKNEVFPENEVSFVSSPVFTDDTFKGYNSEYAAEEIAELGGVPEFTMIVPNTPYLEDTAKILKDDWEKIGVTVHVISLDPRDVFENAVKTNNYDMILFGNALENDSDLFPFWHSSQRVYPGLNLSLYKNDKVDSLIETIQRESSSEKRKELRELIGAYVTEDAPALFLYSVPYTYVARDEIGGIPFFSVIPENRFTDPSNRFSSVTEWFVSQARILK